MRVSDAATKPGQRLLPLAAKGHCRPTPDIHPGELTDAKQPLARDLYPVAPFTRVAVSECECQHALAMALVFFVFAFVAVAIGGNVDTSTVALSILVAALIAITAGGRNGAGALQLALRKPSFESRRRAVAGDPPRDAVAFRVAVGA